MIPGDRILVLLPLALGQREVEPEARVVPGVALEVPRLAWVADPTDPSRVVGYRLVRVWVDGEREARDFAIERVSPLPAAANAPESSPLG